MGGVKGCGACVAELVCRAGSNEFDWEPCEFFADFVFLVAAAACLAGFAFRIVSVVLDDF